MAKRNYRKSSKKIQPSELTLTFNLQGGKGYIDLSQCVSLVNRRFYRQGLNWAVNDFKFLFSSQPEVDAGVAVSVNRLPNTWIMSNAWEKGFRAWQRMNDDSLMESPSIKPKFLDFKIYLDNEHHTNGFNKNLTPSTSSINYLGTTDFQPGEWESSKFVIPDTQLGATGGVLSREVIAVGPSYPGISVGTGLDAVSLIEGYAASRGLPNIQDPNTPGDALSVDGATPQNWLSATFNDGTEQDDTVITDMVTENNIAPYPFEDDGVNTDTMYPGGANNASGLTRHDTAFVTNTTVGGTTHLKGGSFPCGLLEINTGKLAGILQISLVPGSHRGYLAESMTDM